MKKILANGVLAILTIGVFIFLAKLVVFDFLVGLFSPLILLLPVPNYLVTPLSLGLLLLLIPLMGVIFSQTKINQFIKGILKQKIPSDILNKRGALLKLREGVWLIAAIIKETELKRENGESEKLYVLYLPSVPIPWSGWPTMFARKEEVITVKLSYFQLYEIIVSFGQNIPAVLEELKSKGLA